MASSPHVGMMARVTSAWPRRANKYRNVIVQRSARVLRWHAGMRPEPGGPRVDVLRRAHVSGSAAAAPARELNGAVQLGDEPIPRRVHDGEHFRELPRPQAINHVHEIRDRALPVHDGGPRGAREPYLRDKPVDAPEPPPRR